jgi:hypothetical protein
MVDPDPRVAGNGLQLLREKGLDVVVDVEGRACRDINAPFVFRVLHKRAYSVVAVAVQDATSKSIITEDDLVDCFAHASQEVDTLMITFQQLKEIETNSGTTAMTGAAAAAAAAFSHLPAHVKVAILVPSSCERDALQRVRTYVCTLFSASNSTVVSVTDCRFRVLHSEA